MAYDWSLLGIKEITNLFLYGAFNPPTDKANEGKQRKQRGQAWHIA